MAESKLVAQAWAKRFYKVGEVARLAGVEPYVLRYWETEFSHLRPGKTRGGQRLYRPRDIECVLRIKDLLHQQGFTIAGARRRLNTEGAVAGKAGTSSSVELLEGLRGEIVAILTMMEANDKQ